jgi:hypothetical protein
LTLLLGLGLPHEANHVVPVLHQCAHGGSTDGAGGTQNENTLRAWRARIAGERGLRFKRHGQGSD